MNGLARADIQHLADHHRSSLDLLALVDDRAAVLLDRLANGTFTQLTLNELGTLWRMAKCEHATLLLQPSLDDLAQKINAWGAVTFPASTPESTAEHLRREVVDEIMQDPTNGEEQADAFFLIVQLARVSGNDLAAEVSRKWKINQARSWQEPDDQGVVLHVREEDAA